MVKSAESLWKIHYGFAAVSLNRFRIFKKTNLAAPPFLLFSTLSPGSTGEAFATVHSVHGASNSVSGVTFEMREEARCFSCAREDDITVTAGVHVPVVVTSCVAPPRVAMIKHLLSAAEQRNRRRRSRSASQAAALIWFQQRRYASTAQRPSNGH